MVSRTSQHALRAVLYLARRWGEGPVPVETIADALGAPRNYLSKTLNVLARHDIVDGVRGVHGGFTLAVAPDRLPLARVVDLFDEPRTTGVCLLGGRPCNAAAPCAAHRRWTAITDAARAPLATTTVADLLGDPAAVGRGPVSADPARLAL
jgi:Rrf2 family protein